MTQKQVEVYKYIRDYLTVYKHTPSIEEIGRNFRKQRGCVITMLKRIQQKGFITYSDNLIEIIK